MIIDFRFKNFRSFRGEARLCLSHGNGSGLRDSVHAVAAIYGANASGKTNVVRALAMMRGMVLDSAGKNSTDRLAYQPFAFAKGEEEPYLTEITFDLDGKVYRYGYQVSEEEVQGEWLFESDDFSSFANGEERMLFTIAGDELEGDMFEEVRSCFPRKRANMFMLVRLDQDNNKLAGRILKWFTNLTVIRAYDDPRFYRYSHEHILMNDYRSPMMDWVRSADPTIVEATEAPIGAINDRTGLVPAQIQFVRKVIGGDSGVSLPFADFESSGTQKIFCMAGPFVDILKNGYTVVFDEFESKLHPNLTRQLVGRFARPEINPNGAQLIVTTHDVELIRSGAIKRDQIFFCDKNLQGESTLYSLRDFKDSGRYGSRELADCYLSGVFGAVPGI